MGELIIGWTEQTRTEQSVASECMLTQILMALTSLSAMQLHNDTKKPWPEMVTGEVQQMKTELLYPQITNWQSIFFLSPMPIKTECRKKRKSAAMATWYTWYREIRRETKKNDAVYQYTQGRERNASPKIIQKSREKKAKTCSYDHRWIIKHKKTEVLHCHHISTKQQRSEDAMGLADIMWRQCF